jgi:hypothetical protein
LCRNAFEPYYRPDGEIGRHASLRGWCRQRCASSSLVLGTNIKPDCNLQSGFLFIINVRVTQSYTEPAQSTTEILIKLCLCVAQCDLCESLCKFFNLLPDRIAYCLKYLRPYIQIVELIIVSCWINPVTQKDIGNPVFWINPYKCSCIS